MEKHYILARFCHKCHKSLGDVDFLEKNFDKEVRRKVLCDECKAKA